MTGLSEKNIAAHPLLTPPSPEVSGLSVVSRENLRARSRHHLHLQLGRICRAGIAGSLKKKQLASLTPAWPSAILPINRPMVGLADDSSPGGKPLYLSFLQGCDAEEEKEKQGAQASADAA